jgi:hypothetical protein
MSDARWLGNVADLDARLFEFISAWLLLADCLGARRKNGRRKEETLVSGKRFVNRGHVTHVLFLFHLSDSLQPTSHNTLFIMDTEPTLHERKVMDLPPELFGPIIQYLSEDRQDLCAISLVCKILQDEGQRQLYRKITFSRHTPSDHIKFLKCIVDNNRLALLVQEYAQFDIAVYRSGTLWIYLCRGLRAMVNLQVLKFRASDGQFAAEILRNCTFHLRVLVWGNPGDEDHL